MIPFKTKAEQKVEYLAGLKRPLTDDESDELRRSLHAVYCRDRRTILEMHRAEELETLRNVQREATSRERYGREL